MMVKKFWWVLLVLILLFATTFKKEGVRSEYVTTTAVGYEWGLSTCEASRKAFTISNPSFCVADCVQLIPSKVFCVQSVDSLYASVDLGKEDYVYYYNRGGSCEGPVYDCLYGSVPPPPSVECNTAADTDCDGCVSDSEFPVSIIFWKKQIAGITDSVFGQAILKWQSQEGCYNG